MRLAAVTVVAALLLAGCAEAPGGETREAWRAERPPAQEIGQEASLSFNALEWHLTGPMDVGTVTAPFTFVASPGNSTGAWIFFPDARIPGAPSGLLAVQASSVAVLAGSVAGLDALVAHGDGGVEVGPETSARRAPATVDLPSDWMDAERPYRTARFVAAPVENLELQGFDRALLWRQDGAVEVEELPSVTAPGWMWADGARLRLGAQDLPLQVAADRFGLAGDLKGSVLTTTLSRIVDPAGVFGNIATLNLDDDRVWSEGDFRLTQVLRGGDVLFDASIEVQPTESILVVAAGQRGWIGVNYRETTYFADAVLDDVQITGSASEMVRLPIRSESLVEELWQVVADVAEDAPWAAPFMAVPVALTTPFVALAEVASCTFGECPQAHPYPVWMPAGDVGIFYVRVDADEPGDYSATVWLHGQNFRTETFTFAVKVS